MKVVEEEQRSPFYSEILDGASQVIGEIVIDFIWGGIKTSFKFLGEFLSGL